MVKINKLYRVLVDIKWSDEYYIRAKNKTEAKRKGINKFRNSSRNFQADAEFEESY